MFGIGLDIKNVQSRYFELFSTPLKIAFQTEGIPKIEKNDNG